MFLLQMPYALYHEHIHLTVTATAGKYRKCQAEAEQIKASNITACK